MIVGAAIIVTHITVLQYFFQYRKMPHLWGRAKNIDQRTPNAQLVHDRQLNRTYEEHSSADKANQVASTCANENSLEVFVLMH